MPIKLNSAASFQVLITGATAAGVESNHIYRPEHTIHQIQVSNTGSAAAHDFVVYTSNDGDTWVPIRDQADCDASVAAYGSGATALSGVIQLNGCYPWLKIVTGAGSTAAFSATLYSMGREVF